MKLISSDLIDRLEEKAFQIRKDVVYATGKIGYSHIGGMLSMMDMTVALYYHFLKFDPKNPQWEDRDRLVLSKGHCALCLYCIFADLGMYTREELYEEYNKIDGRFGMHPNRLYVDGIEVSLGSLGHGLSVATGMALAGRLDKKNHRIFCIVGDGELNEGSNWEAYMAAAHHELGNLVAIVDCNGRQRSGVTKQIMNTAPLEEKLRAFNWDVITLDGNNMEQVVNAFASLPLSDSQVRRKPICIIGNTVKGKGLKPAEESHNGWHVGVINEKNLQECIDSVEAMRKAGKV